MVAINKLEVVIGEIKEVILGTNLTVTTSSNANQPVALVIRDNNEVVAEFASWTYWHKLE